jgi:hypothetical protein
MPLTKNVAFTRYETVKCRFPTGKYSLVEEMAIFDEPSQGTHVPRGRPVASSLKIRWAELIVDFSK